MSDVELYAGDPDNPEGYPICPKCREFVDEEGPTFEHYICDSCGYRFPIEEALED